MKETRKTLEKINEAESRFFEKIVKIDKPSSKPTKTKKEKSQSLLESEREGDFTTDLTEIKS